MVYTRVYSSLLGRRYTLGISTPRTRILLSSAYAPPRPYPRTMVISCVSPARGTYSHILPISMVLGQKVNSPLITHSISNIPRASQRSYREYHSALTESVTALLPRASQRPYRERLSALTESVTALLPRALLGSLLPLRKGSQNVRDSPREKAPAIAVIQPHPSAVATLPPQRRGERRRPPNFPSARGGPRESLGRRLPCTWRHT